MVGSWYMLLPVLLPVFSGLAVAFVPALNLPARRNAFTLAMLVVSALLVLPLLLLDDMTLTLFTLSDNLPSFSIPMRQAGSLRR